MIDTRLPEDTHCHAAIAYARSILRLCDCHGSFVGWLDAHHPLDSDGWVELFRRALRFTGGEITGEFLMSVGYLPGAHHGACPGYRRVLEADPPWVR